MTLRVGLRRDPPWEDSLEMRRGQLETWPHGFVA